MLLCDRCIHEAVCGICAATGGRMRSCVHFIESSTQPDENGCIATPRLPRIQDEIAVTLTREQWCNVQACMETSRDENKSRVYMWERFCADPQMAAENAALYRGYAEGAVAILAIIEEALNPSEPQKEGNNDVTESA